MSQCTAQPIQLLAGEFLFHAFQHEYICFAVEDIDTATPGTSAHLPPPYEMAGCEPPAYPGAVMAPGSSAVSNDPIPMYKC